MESTICSGSHDRIIPFSVTFLTVTSQVMVSLPLEFVALTLTFLTPSVSHNVLKILSLLFWSTSSIDQFHVSMLWLAVTLNLMVSFMLRIISRSSSLVLLLDHEVISGVEMSVSDSSSWTVTFQIIRSLPFEFVVLTLTFLTPMESQLVVKLS